MIDWLAIRGLCYWFYTKLGVSPERINKAMDHIKPMRLDSYTEEEKEYGGVIDKMNLPVKIMSEMRSQEFKEKMDIDIRKAVDYKEEEREVLEAIYMVGFARGRGL